MTIKSSFGEVKLDVNPGTDPSAAVLDPESPQIRLGHLRAAETPPGHAFQYTQGGNVGERRENQQRDA